MFEQGFAVAPNLLRFEAVFVVVSFLLGTAARGFFNCFGHRSGDLVCVHQDPAVDIARCPTGGLGERSIGPQKALLVGVHDGHERHLWDVEPFPQEVHADQDIKSAISQLPNDFDAIEGLDVAVDVGCGDT